MMHDLILINPFFQLIFVHQRSAVFILIVMLSMVVPHVSVLVQEAVQVVVMKRNPCVALMELFMIVFVT